MTLVLTTNVVGQPRGEPVRLPGRRRRLSTVVARHRPPAGRRFIVSVHRRGDVGDAYPPSDRTVRLRAIWPKTLVGPADVVVITLAPLGKGVASIGLAIASIALIALAPYAAPALAGSALFGAGAAAGGLTTAIQAGMVVGGLALGYAAQASKAAAKKASGELYSVSGGGNVPKPGARKPVLYGRRWTSPPLSQPDYFAIDGDANVLTKRMTLGLGKFQIHRIRVGDALFWDAATGIQAPFNAATGPQGAAVEFLYAQASTLVPGDIIPSPSVGGQELPRPGGNPARTPWYRLAPQGVSVDAAQFNWTYPAIYRVSSSGKSGGAPAGVVFFGREIDPNTGAVLGPEFELWRSAEPNDAYIRTPLRRNAYFRLPKSGAYEVSAQNAYPEPLPGVEIENRVIWDGMFAFEDDTRVRPDTTEIVLRVRAGKGLTVTAFGDISVEATRILPVWDGTAWTEQPTRKAVWAFCDLVRSGYGLDRPDGVEADKALHYATLLTANDTYDGQLPEVSSFWEAASEVLHPLRADPVKVGAVHSFVRDESRAEPRHVLTRRQIVRDSSGASYSTKVEGGDVIVEFDRDGDPRRPDEARYSYGPPTRTPKRYRVAGITDGLHALKHATWLAAVAVFRGVERKITTEWDGRLVYPGDHVLSDLWFLKGKQAYGVASRVGTVLQLDATANVSPEWGYGSVRTRVGREWGILRMRGVGARGLEIHPDDVAALEAQTGLGLAAVLTREAQDPTTIVLGDLVELQETYVVRAALPSDADHVQIEMVQDDPRVWQLLDETVIAPAPVNGDALAEPLVPQISVLHARCVRIETGIEVVWGVSATRGARNYEADLSYDAGATWETLSPFGPESSGRASMRQIDGPVTVRARAYGRTGLPGAWIATTFTTITPLVRSAYVEGLDDILAGVEQDFRDLGLLVDGVRGQAQQALDQARQIIDDAKLQGESQQKQLAAAVGRLRDEVREVAEAAATVEGNNYENRQLLKVSLEGRVQDAFAAILNESELRITATTALARTTDTLAVRLGTSEAAISTERQSRIDADGVQSGQITTAYARLESADLKIPGQASAQQGLMTRVTTAEGGLTSLSQSYTTLNSAVTSPSTGLVANANALSQLTTRTTVIEADTGNLNRTINNQAQSLVVLNSAISNPTTGLTATASAVSSLTTRVTVTESDTRNLGTVVNNQAQAIVGLNSAISDPSTGLSANSSAINTLSTSVTVVRGDVNNLGTVVNNQAQAITGLNSAINDPSRGLSASANAITSLSTSVTTIQGDTANLNRVVNAQATSLTSLTSRVGGSEATISVLAQTSNGLSARFSVLGNINGATGGFQMFGVAKNDGTVAYNLEVLGGLIVTGSITGRTLATSNIISGSAQIGNLVVDNLQVADGAITQCVSAYSDSNVAQVQITVRRPSSNVQVEAYFKGNSAQGTNAGPGGLFIQRNGQTLNQTNASFALYKPDSGNLQFYIGPMSAAVRDAPGAGTHTYTVTHSNGAGLGGVTVIVTELSK